LSLLDQVIAYVGDQRLTRDVVSEVLGVADRRVLVELAGAVIGRDPGTALRILARSADSGVDLGQLARAFLGFLRDLEIVARVSDAADLVDATPDELQEARGLIGKAGQAGLGLFGVLFDRWARAVDESARSQSPRLILEMAVVDLCQAEPLEPLGDLLERLEGLEDRLAGGGAGAARGPGAPRSAAQAQVPAGAPPRGPGATVAAAPRVAVAPAPLPPAPLRKTEPADPTPPSASALPSRPAAPAPSSPAPSASPVEVWKRVRSSFEEKRPRLAALLAHAEVGAVEVGAGASGRLTLHFPDRPSVDAAEKARGEIEQALAAAFGQPTRLTLTGGQEGGGGAAAPGAPAATIRSEVAAEAEALSADRKNREAEARQHPMIKKAQDLFGASLKEIKT
jgi:DNA polymerase-3 subunit gamma/tau